MKQLGTKTYITLGSSIVFFGILLFLGIFSLFIPNSNVIPIDFDDEYISSRYINENSAIVDAREGEDFTVDGGGIEESKQGILEVDENRKIIKIDATLSEEDITTLENKYDIEFTNDTNTNGIYVLNISSESNVEGLEKELNKKLETDIPVKISAEVIDWGISRIGADKVWESGSGQGILVAIIDTGVQKDHPDLSNNLVQGYDFVNNDSDATDDNGHGTHVAGITSATLNQAGMVGASHSSKILPIKALNSDGYGYLSDVAKAVYYATDNGARVINMSLGTTSDSSTLRDAINYAASKGVLMVAAAGNGGGAPCSYPAAYGNVICVMATDNKNLLASFSNIGGELSAPGVYNYSTYIGSTYRYLSGTSMASPHVAGSAALLISICTSCSTNDIRNLLRDTAVDLGEAGYDILFGYGLVDLTSAVSSLQITEPEPVQDEEPSTPEPIDEEKTDTRPTTKPTTPSKSKKITQTILLSEPQVTKGKKYIPTSLEDITAKYTLEPISSDTNLDKVILYVDNEEINFSNNQTAEFTISKDLFNHSQHWIKVTAFFKDGSQSSAQIIVDMTYLKSIENTSIPKPNMKSVKGISLSILNLFNIFSYSK